MSTIKHKTALVLAGGGLTGAVYEIGALRAIDDLLVDRTVNDFDIYVGTSAGAFVASFIANGISPESMMQAIQGAKSDLQPIRRNNVFDINWREYLRWGVKVPPKIVAAWCYFIRNFNDMTLFDLFWSFSETLPSGFFEGEGLSRFIQQGFSQLNCTDNFYDLDREMFIIATDLDTGKRAIFGNGYLNAPISKAVAASSAFPVVYKPVRIDDHEYIDGGLRGTASIDLAIERGAKLIVCINPLVPFNNQNRDCIPFINKRGGYLSGKGVPSITNQTIRIMSHSSLHYHLKQTQRANPDVDIILIEPRSEDYQMFFCDIMRYSTRLIVAKHGFETVSWNIAVDYKNYRDILTRHGIPISQLLISREIAEMESSNFDPLVIREILEARSSHCGQLRNQSPICQLNRALAELDLVLDNFTQA